MRLCSRNGCISSFYLGRVLLNRDSSNLSVYLRNVHVQLVQKHHRASRRVFRRGFGSECYWNLQRFGGQVHGAYIPEQEMLR